MKTDTASTRHCRVSSVSSAISSTSRVGQLQPDHPTNARGQRARALVDPACAVQQGPIFARHTCLSSKLRRATVRSDEPQAPTETRECWEPGNGSGDDGLRTCRRLRQYQGCDHCLALDEHVLTGQISPVPYQKQCSPLQFRLEHLGRRIFLASIRFRRRLQVIVEATICHRLQLIFGECLDQAKYRRGLVPRHLNKSDAIHVGKALCDLGQELHGNTHAKYIETPTRCASNEKRCPKFQFPERCDIYREALPASWCVGTNTPILRRQLRYALLRTAICGRNSAPWHVLAPIAPSTSCVPLFPDIR